MKHIICIAAVAMAALAIGAARADDSQSDPPGITPTTMTLEKLIALNRAAEGHQSAGASKMLVEVDAYQDGVQSGTETTYRSGDDFRVDVSLGVFHNSYGQIGGKEWEQNRNGLTRMLTGLHQRDEENREALSAFGTAKDNDVKLLGEVQQPVHAYVVKVAPKSGRIEYRFYDPSSYLLVRDERAIEGERVVYTYEDYRTTGGIRQPWHVHATNGEPGDDLDWKTQTLTVGQSIDAARFAIPPSFSNVSFSGDRSAIPAKLDGDRVIVAVDIGGRKVNLQLDSGADGILLNRDVADAVGVKSYGSRTANTAGKYVASDAMIPTIRINTIEMRNVAAETAPYAQMTDDGVPVAGLMGYDFIAGGILHIDYYDGTAELIAPSAFKPPAGAIMLPIRLDDGVPVITARVGKSQGPAFIVDTGADRSMIFSAFAHAHPGDVDVNGQGNTIESSFPFIGSIYGVGGKVETRPVQISSFTVGTVSFANWPLEVSQNAPAFEADDYDGLIGQDVLRYFDVFFDYRDTTMYLVPNERYRDRWGS